LQVTNYTKEKLLDNSNIVNENIKVLEKKSFKQGDLISFAKFDFLLRMEILSSITVSSLMWLTSYNAQEFKHCRDRRLVRHAYFVGCTELDNFWSSNEKSKTLFWSNFYEYVFNHDDDWLNKQNKHYPYPEDYDNIKKLFGTNLVVINYKVDRPSKLPEQNVVNVKHDNCVMYDLQIFMPTLMLIRNIQCCCMITDTY